MWNVLILDKKIVLINFFHICNFISKQILQHATLSMVIHAYSATQRCHKKILESTSFRAKKYHKFLRRIIKKLYCLRFFN